MKSSITELKTEWTDRIYSDDVRDAIADIIGLSMSSTDYDELEKALYWLKTMAENPYNDSLRVLWTALQVMTEIHPAEIPF